ncbi:MAG TPA: hypothetical protein VIV60_24935 [Polyangiaceae bacterium]
MNQEQRWAYLMQLDRELLQGGVVHSEWCSLIVREADTAFANGANLAAILTAVSGIETYLRSETSQDQRVRLVDLINDAMIDDELKQDLHTLRKYRNSWVHVGDPSDDSRPLENPQVVVQELESMAQFAVRVLRRTIYADPWL